VLRPPPTQGPYGRDFEAYYAAGATWNAGGDPWSRAVWATERTIGGVDPSRDELLPYVGPAAALPLFGALARLPHPVAIRLWTGLLIVALVALVIASLALARQPVRYVFFAALAFAGIAGPMTSALALGQTALISAAAIACALVAYERRSLFSGVTATLVAALQPNLALALVARMRDRTAWTCALAGAAAFAALTLACGGGIAGLAAYVHRLGEHGRAEAVVAIQHTPAAVAWSLGASPSSATSLGSAIALATIAAVVLATIRLRLNALDGTLLAIAALPLAIPFFHEHDFVVELIPLLVLAVRARGLARAWTGVAAVLILVDWFGLAQRAAADGQILAEGVAIAFAFVALRPTSRASRTDVAAFATLALTACVAVPLAHAVPAPTWPDGLPVGYRAPASADASGVWADEQRAAGLTAREPAWGALRALPLAGCVVLGIAVVLSSRRRPVEPACPEPVEGSVRCRRS
jgi:glycosyl transferase family 87